jgi:aspartate racemase
MTEHGVIGIVSGLGPLAGSDVLAKALEHAAWAHGCVEDADYPDFVVLSHGIDTFDATHAVGERFVAALVEVVQELDLHHPDVIGVACNTAHLYLDVIRRNTKAEVVNLIEQVASSAAALNWRYLLLSSSTTRRTGLYRHALDAHGVQYEEVSADEQLAIDEIVHLVMGDNVDVAGKRLDDLVRALHRDREFAGVIAACTELPIAFDNGRIARQVPVIDSNRVLANALVDASFRITAARTEGETHGHQDARSTA